MNLVKELSELITVLEATIPASPLSPSSKRLEEGLEDDLRKYFRALEKAMPKEKIAALYRKHVKE